MSAVGTFVALLVACGVPIAALVYALRGPRTHRVAVLSLVVGYIAVVWAAVVVTTVTAAHGKEHTRPPVPATIAPQAGGESVTVPTLTGRCLGDAEGFLAHLGLRLSYSRSAGVIVTQQPPAGAHLARGHFVRIEATHEPRCGG